MFVEYTGGAHGYENIFQEFAHRLLVNGGFELKHVFFLHWMVVAVGVLIIFTAYKIVKSIKGE